MENEGFQHTSAKPRVFQLQFLKDITNNFSRESEIGHGAYGVVYKGVLNNGEMIAVKRLHNHLVDDKEFKNEITKLMAVQHPNIVQLLGYCYDTSNTLMEVHGNPEFVGTQERALCLEYLQRGSLEGHLSDELHGHEWHLRYRIIKGICEGLKHLHTWSEKPIFHLDLKPGNILLDTNMMPKIADFGISILLGSMQTCVIKTVTGTKGYMAPEYITQGKISPKSDVYSLGVIMIRIIAGNQGFENYDPHRPPKEFIECVHVNWAKRQHPTMSLNSLEQVRTCTKIALSCMEFDRRKRPTITDIVSELNKIDTAQSSAVGGQDTEKEEHITLKKESDIHEQKEKKAEHLEEKMKEQVDGRTSILVTMSSRNESMLVKGLRLAVELINGMNECVNLFRWAKSTYLRSQQSESHGHDLQGDVSYLQSGGSGSREQHLSDDVSHMQSGRIGSQEQDLPDDVLHLQSGQSVSQEQDHQDGALLHVHNGHSGSHDQDRQDDALLRLQKGIGELRDTLPVMYNLIDRAEWRSHETHVAELLPILKDAVYNADDLLDEFRWYEMKAELEGTASKSPFTGFIDTLIGDSFEKLKDVRGRLKYLSGELKRMGLYKAMKRFDKSVRPETTAMPSDEKIFGRNKELKQVMGFLGVPTNAKRKRGEIPVNASTSTSPSNQVSNESRKTHVSVLPIVGIGGVGKTTLGQHICKQPQVKSHFDLIIWICVSDDFDEKRLFKEVIQSCPKKKAKTNDGDEPFINNLDSLSRALSEHVKNKRFLIVLDDIWGDALKDNRQSWNRFCSPLGSAKDGSMMLITTRCPKVAEGVGTMKPVMIEGLKDEVFWNFFKLCVFGSDNSSNDPELEHIAKCILPKLKGSPLAAKTLGRMLRMDLQVSHWNSILKSDLWELTQEPTDILPALRLSYMYLPFHLKQCLSFCAVYPKDYKFEKENLAEIWVAEGFVKPQGDDSLIRIGCQYFEDLVARSFYQKVRGGYVIHDLLHDMVQKVSEHDCFILRNKNDFGKVPPNVRHIYVYPSSDFDNSDLLRLGKHTKLRTIICKKQSGNKESSVMDNWCGKLLRLRVMTCASTNKLPDSIGNLKHLRYLKISKGRPLSIPPTFSLLYNLQIFDVKTCKIESLPDDFSNLSNLQRFVAQEFLYNPVSTCHINAAEQVQELRLMKNLNQFRGHMEISNVQMLTEDDATEAKLKNKKDLTKLTLKWPDDPDDPQVIHHNAIQVFQVLQPPTSLRSLLLKSYPGVSLPSCLEQQMINIDEIPPVINDSIGIFPSLTDLTISGCQNLSSLENFLHPDYVPAIKKISLENCKSLLTVPTERFGDFSSLEELEVDGCPNICSQSLVSPSLKWLKLSNCGGLMENIDCRSLTTFIIMKSFSHTSIELQMWSLPALQELTLLCCYFLTSIRVSTTLPFGAGTDNIRALSKLTSIKIIQCGKLSIADGLLTQEYLPAVERIEVYLCSDLLSLSGERFGGLSSLKHLKLSYCPLLNWQSGLVLPSSLQTLCLKNCGDFSACVPGCLENLTSLVSLKMDGCKGLTSIPANIWVSKLALLEKLEIWNFPDLVSIGGAKAVARIKEVSIYECPKLEEAMEMRIGRWSPGWN